MYVCSDNGNFGVWYNACVSAASILAYKARACSRAIGSDLIGAANRIPESTESMLLNAIKVMFYSINVSLDKERERQRERERHHSKTNPSVNVTVRIFVI